MKILIVDDEPLLLRLFAVALEREGNQVLTALEGRAALERARTDPPDIILMDLKMKGMDGIEAVRQLKSRAETARIPVIALTGAGTKENVVAVLKAGAEDCIVKSDLQFEVLKRRIAAAIERNRGPERAAPPPPASLGLKIEVRLRKAVELKALPFIVAEILQVTAKDRTNARVLSETIERDPTMAARVLQLANSAFYAIHGRIQSLHQAVTLIGLNGIRHLALTASLIEEYRRGNGKAGLDRLALWKHSLACAVLAKDLAAAAGASPEESEDAFLAGLLHDIGKAFLDDQFGEDYAGILGAAARGGKPLHVAEREGFGMDHAEVAKLILEKWKLPDSLIAPVRYHHHSWTDIGRRHGANHRPAGFVQMANALAKARLIGAGGDETLEEIPDALVSSLGLTSERVRSVLANLESQVEDLTQVLILHDVEEARRMGSIRLVPPPTRSADVLLVREIPLAVDTLALFLERMECRPRIERTWDGRPADLVILAASSPAWLTSVFDRLQSPWPGTRIVCLGPPLPPDLRARLEGLGARFMGDPVPVREIADALATA